MQAMDRITKKSLKRQKFLKISKIDLFKIAFCVKNLARNEARDMKFGTCMQKKITNKLQEAEF